MAKFGKIFENSEMGGGDGEEGGEKAEEREAEGAANLDNQNVCL